MKHLSKKKLNALIKDERMAVREYKSLGLPSLAKDESKHLNFFKMLKERKRKKR